MKEKLIKLETDKLLKKFGSGNHKPGSGSAAAFQGMLSANLIHTVITLTTEEKRRKYYGDFFSELQEMDTDILSRILPSLETLFENDSVHFDKVISLRNAREDEKNLVKKSEYEIEHLAALKIATELPLEIGRLCAAVAKISAFIFENGFQAARGDSSVSLNGAVSAIAGCLSIIDLNLLSFSHNEWTRQIRTAVDALRIQHENLIQDAFRCSSILQEESNQKDLCNQEVSLLVKKYNSSALVSDKDIEESAIQLQRIIWKYKETIWKREKPSDPIQILKPEKVFKNTLGYQFYHAKEINPSTINGIASEVAGIIDQNRKVVYISNRFAYETQNFTAAHELGHAIFHKQNVLHRDRALDGSLSPTKRNKQEYQADKFATYFLMPRKQIQETFKKYFGTELFLINEDNAFNLIQARPSKLKAQCRTLRGLSRRLASTESFGRNRMVSIAKTFNVSVEAMAIRLEELKLVAF